LELTITYVTNEGRGATAPQQGYVGESHGNCRPVGAAVNYESSQRLAAHSLVHGIRTVEIQLCDLEKATQAHYRQVLARATWNMRIFYRSADTSACSIRFRTGNLATTLVQNWIVDAHVEFLSRRRLGIGVLASYTAALRLGQARASGSKDHGRLKLTGLSTDGLHGQCRLSLTNALSTRATAAHGGKDLQYGTDVWRYVEIFAITTTVGAEWPQLLDCFPPVVSYEFARILLVTFCIAANLAACLFGVLTKTPARIQARLRHILVTVDVAGHVLRHSPTTPFVVTRHVPTDRTAL
jgi:hypothetical protein